MADRDWDKELAKVDKQLASLSDDALLGPPPTTGAKGAAPARATKGEPISRAASEPRATSSCAQRLLIASSPTYGLPEKVIETVPTVVHVVPSLETIAVTVEPVLSNRR